MEDLFVKKRKLQCKIKKLYRIINIKIAESRGNVYCIAR